MDGGGFAGGRAGDILAIRLVWTPARALRSNRISPAPPACRLGRCGTGADRGSSRMVRPPASTGYNYNCTFDEDQQYSPASATAPAAPPQPAHGTFGINGNDRIVASFSWGLPGVGNLPR